MPGYMPDENIAVSTLAEAKAIACEYKRFFNDSRGDGERVITGNIYRDWYASNGDNSISVVECAEEDCWREDGELWTD